MSRPTKPPVRVWFRVAGPALPKVPTRIGRFTLQPVDPENEPDLPDAVPDLSHAPSAFVSRFLPEVHGTAYACIELEGVHAGNAVAKATEHEVPLLVAALSLGHDEPYRVVPIFAVDGNELITATEGMFVSWDDADLDPAAAAEISSTHDRLENDPTARRAAHSLAHALALHDRAPTVELWSAAVLNYFKVIEAIAATVAIAEPPDADAQRERAVAALRRRLNGGEPLAQQQKAIRRTRDKLMEIDQNFTGRRIEAVARAYGVDDAITKSALSLARFRNEKLGHAATPPTVGELERWLTRDEPGSAPQLARTFLLAHLKHRSTL